MNNQSLLLVVEKPLTKILPELYEENNDTPKIYTDLLNTKKAADNLFCLRRKKPKESKKKILHANFNMH